MIRIRSKFGKTITVDEPLRFVEILDSNDKVAMVFHKENLNGIEAVNVITPDMSDETESYSQLYGVSWSEKINGSWPKPKPMELDIS